MIHLARFAIRRPVVALLGIGAIVIALSLVGLGVSSSLSPSITTVPGTESSHAAELAESEFGPSTLVPILLEGPQAELDRQGPALVRDLSLRRDTRVLSAWDAGPASGQLRPRKDAAMIVASVAEDQETMVKTDQAEIEALVDRTIRAPVTTSITGQPSIDRALKDEAIDTTRRAVAIAIPVLFLVLLLVLRAPVAAVGITAVGAATALAGLGITALLGKVTEVDPVAVALGTMDGLVLGAAYAVFLYRRWTELIDSGEAGHDAAGAAAAAVTTTGRALLIGATALITADLVAAAVGPTEVLTSLFITATACGLLAVGAAVIVVPAALTLLGERVHAFRFPVPAPMRRAWGALSGGGGRIVIRDAVVVGAAATALLAVLAIPLLSIETGPPSAKFLPEDDPARVSFERVATVMGPGWPTPYNIVVGSEKRPITDPALLKAFHDFEDDLAHDPRIDSVIGPGAIAAQTKDLSALPKQLEDSSALLKTGKKDLGTLAKGLGQASAGVATLRSGLSQAAGGSGTAQSGAGQLREGLDQARAGAGQISAGLNTALVGARKLRDGAGEALTGSQKISGGLGEAVKPVQAGAPIVKQMAADIAAGTASVKGAQGSAQAVTAALDDASARVQAMPEGEGKAAALAAIASARQASGGLNTTLGASASKLAGASGIATAFSGQVAELSSGLAQLYAGSTSLTKGIAELRGGNSELAAGIDRLASGGGQLTSGVTQLRDGAAELEAGLGQLSTGLAGGVGPSGQLVSGLSGAATRVAKFRGDLPSPEDLERLQRESPGLFDSGYFVLAAVEGAQPDTRKQASFAVNLDAGGDAAQMTVISRYAAEDPRSQELGEDLKEETESFALATNTEAALGGPAGSLGDFRSESASRIWPVVIAVAVIITLLLMVFLRAAAIPVAVVGFDVLTASAALGVMSVLFTGDDPLLGGPGYIDPMSIIAVFVGLFNITIIFTVQLLWRTREAFLATGDPQKALRSALDHTAGASTAAALVMIAVIVPFAMSELVFARQLPVGILVVLVLNALIVRPVLMPAAVAVLGRAAWWPLSRQAPHPPAAPSGPAAPDADAAAVAGAAS